MPAARKKGGRPALPPTADLVSLDDVRRELAERRLSEFTRQAWHVIEPATPFVPGWHLDTIAEHLEAVFRGEIRNLLVNMPPRCMKSISIAVMWPMWVWVKHPATRWLFSSYAQPLATRDSLKSRRLIESPWFQKWWGDRFALTSDQNQKTRFENDRTGYRLATSVDGSTTGEGGDLVVADDPHNMNEALSEAERERVLIWWDETMSTRLNNPQTGRKVIVMQRLHERDLSGHVLEQGGYEHLLLPMEYEPKRRCVTVIGFEDPREEAGELLWPDRFRHEEVERLKVELGEYGAAGQLQQRPSPRSGGLFKRDWFQVIEEIPACSECVAARGWDLAGSKPKPGNADPDYTVGLQLRYCPKKHGFLVADMLRVREEPADVQQKIENTSSQDGHDCIVALFQDPAQAGKYQAQNFVKLLKGFRIEIIPTTRGLHELVDPVRPQAQVGNVKLLRGPWNETFLSEVCNFPVARHDDIVAALGAAFYALTRPVEEPKKKASFGWGARS